MSAAKPPSRRTLQRQAQAAGVVARLSDANRPLAERFLTAGRARGVKPSSQCTMVYHVLRLDEAAQGRCLLELDAVGWQGVLVRLRDRFGRCS